MDTKAIQDILLKFKQGRCTSEEIEHIHAWYSRLNGHSEQDLSDKEKDRLEEKIYGAILHSIDSESTDHFLEERPAWRWGVGWRNIAAILLLGILGWSIVWYGAHSSRQQTKLLTKNDVPLMKFSNEGNTARTLILADQSKVILEPGAILYYPKDFSGDRRDVQLVGNAFFSIARNTKQPFYVYSGKLVTRVLGTSFNIRSIEKTLEVEVLEGKVSVFEGSLQAIGPIDAGKGVVLTPNQKVQYHTNGGHLTTGIVEHPQSMKQADKTIPSSFLNAKVGVIATNLLSEYGIEILFDQDQLAQCTFTGDLAGLSLFEKLGLICKANNMKYEVQGTRILVSGQGCNSLHFPPNPIP